MTEATQHDTHARKHDAGRTARATIGVLLLALVVAFAVDNRDDIRVGYVFGDTNAAVSVVILATLVIGYVAGWLVAHRSRHTH